MVSVQSARRVFIARVGDFISPPPGGLRAKPGGGCRWYGFTVTLGVLEFDETRQITGFYWATIGVCVFYPGIVGHGSSECSYGFDALMAASARPRETLLGIFVGRCFPGHRSPGGQGACGERSLQDIRTACVRNSRERMSWGYSVATPSYPFGERGSAHVELEIRGENMKMLQANHYLMKVRWWELTRESPFASTDEVAETKVCLACAFPCS
jgi:hypothetical protein